MDEAVARLSQMGRPFDTRKKLVEWLLEARDKPLMRRKYAEAMEVVIVKYEFILRPAMFFRLQYIR